MADKFSPEKRSKIMSAIRNKGSRIELRLAKALWKEGLRYRKNDKTVFGTPDIVFKGKKVAIFIDSEFWHGKNWVTAKDDVKTNSEFWQKKIETNMRRDILVNITLQQQGWTVLRFWGKQVDKELEECVLQIKEALHLPAVLMAAEPYVAYKKARKK